jgi:hypothetical protein
MHASSQIITKQGHACKVYEVLGHGSTAPPAALLMAIEGVGQFVYQILVPCTCELPWVTCSKYSTPPVKCRCGDSYPFLLSRRHDYEVQKALFLRSGQREPLGSSNMAQRPSTSAGPRLRNEVLLAKTSKMQVKDNMQSRDDSALNVRTEGPGLQHYDAGWRPRPSRAETASPQFKSATAPSASMLTFSSAEIQIGMAIGSPSHEPSDHSTWPSYSPATTTNSLQVMPPPQSRTAISPSEPSPQRTKSRRGRLGGWFKSKKSADLGLSGLDGLGVSAPSLTSSPGASAMDLGRGSALDRSNTSGQGTFPKHKPIIIRSQTAPIASMTSEEVSMSRPVLGRHRGVTDDTSIARAGLVPQPSISFSPAPAEMPPSTYSGNLLDVEIPKYSMERYSVMFGGLLGPQPASSLLARRQATLDRLKTLRDEVAAAEEREVDRLGPRQRPRRVTSPQPTKSPAFSLFPSSAKTGSHAPTTPRKLSPLVRSNTSPALLPSPARATFDDQPTRAPMKRGIASSSPRPAVESPMSVYAEAIVDSQPLKPVIASPEWEMVTFQRGLSPSATSSGGSQSEDTSVSATVTPASSLTPSSRARIESPRDRTMAEEAETALKAAAEVSIARQISISHQQRQLLRPLQRPRLVTTSRSMSSGLTTASSPSAYASPSLDHIKKGARAAHMMPIAATKSSTPTLVVPRETLDSQLLQHRKSAWVVLEAA